jgi:hypothetical protein
MGHRELLNLAICAEAAIQSYNPLRRCRYLSFSAISPF